MVSKASDDLPEPLKPVMTMNRLRGRVRSKPLRLCSLAPRMMRESDRVIRIKVIRGKRSQTPYLLSFDTVFQATYLRFFVFLAEDFLLAFFLVPPRTIFAAEMSPCLSM